MIDDHQVSLRDYIDQRLDAAEHALTLARQILADQVIDKFEASQLAIAKAESSINGRLGTTDSTLAAVALRAEGFITRIELSELLSRFDDRNAQNVQTQIGELDAKSQLRLTGSQREFDVWRDGLNERLSLINTATEKAAEAMDRRLEGMNEFRQQLRDQSSQFVTRVELESQSGASEQDHNRIRDALAQAATRIELAAIAEKMDGQQSVIDRSEGRRTVTTAVLALGSSTVISLAVGLILYVINHH